MTVLKVTLNLSEDVLESLQREAGARHVPLDKVVSEVVEEHFQDPSDEEILENLRRAVDDVNAGRVYPVDEVLDILKNAKTEG